METDDLERLYLGEYFLLISRGEKDEVRFKRAELMQCGLG